jgi:hypothetical protein
MIVMSALAALSGLTVLSVQGGLSTTSHDRFHGMATYAAESGCAAAMDFLRANLNAVTGWGAFVSPSNTAIVRPPFLGNDKLPGDPLNPFSTDQQSSYSVEILNNRADSGFVGGTDDDKRVIIRATGHGPQQAIAIIECEVAGDPAKAPLSLTLVGWRQTY